MNNFPDETKIKPKTNRWRLIIFILLIFVAVGYFVWKKYPGILSVFFLNKPVLSPSFTIGVEYDVNKAQRIEAGGTLLPPGFSEDIPLYKGAEVYDKYNLKYSNVEVKDAVLVLITPDEPGKVAEYYREVFSQPKFKIIDDKIIEETNSLVKIIVVIFGTDLLIIRIEQTSRGTEVTLRQSRISSAAPGP